jgi:hypothetical protein
VRPGVKTPVPPKGKKKKEKELPRDYCSCLGKRWWWPSWEVWQQRRSRDIWKTFRRGGSINRAY